MADSPEITEVVVKTRLSTGKAATFTYVPGEFRLVLDGVTFPQGAEKFSESDLEGLYEIARTSLDLGYRWHQFLPKPEPVDEPEEHDRPALKGVAEAAQ